MKLNIVTELVIKGQKYVKPEQGAVTISGLENDNRIN